MTIDEHNASVQGAERDLAGINAQIEAAKREHEQTKPAAAVRAGMPLAEAAARHAAANDLVGFLLDAADTGAAKLREARAARDAANVEAKYRAKFKAAVAKRLEAIRIYEAAKLAVESAEADYEMANRAIEEALAAGLDRPFHLRENPLRLSWTIDHRTKVQLPPAASEAVLWEAYL